MYFPWVGMFEQMCLADDYVDYVDVAFSKGSFTNRVQVKTSAGSKWLTLPLNGMRLGMPIHEIMLDERQNWRRKHRATLAQAYAKAPFVREMLELVDEVFAETNGTLVDVTQRSMRAAHRYFEFDSPRRFHDSRILGGEGTSSQRVLDIVRQLGGARYVTGHGAVHYLDHELFESHGVDVHYMDYRMLEYPQQHPPFTPYVSILDLIASLGKKGRRVIVSQTKSWREMKNDCLVANEHT